MSSIFDAITLAPLCTPSKVETIESQQPSELTQRLKAQASVILENTSLSLKIQMRRRALGYKSEGLDRLLDLTPVDQSEFVLFCRKQSLLQTKISFIRQERTPEEVLKAMLAMAAKGYCRMCYEPIASCGCAEEIRDWV